MYVDVVIPLAVRTTYTYLVPSHLIEKIDFGKRVEVPFGKRKLYAALIVAVHEQAPKYKTKSIISILDDNVVLNVQQFKLWQWMHQYYISSLGAIMYAALPSLLKLHSETFVLKGPNLEAQWEELDNDAYMIAEALSIQERLSIADIQGILQKETVYPFIQELLRSGLIVLEETLIKRYKPKRQSFVRLTESFLDPTLQASFFEKINNAPRQAEAVMALLSLHQQNSEPIPASQLRKKKNVTTATLKALAVKGIVQVFDQNVGRIAFENSDKEEIVLSAAQQLAFDQLKAAKSQVRLLHGVTGAGKTEIYCKYIQQILSAQQQVLFLLPEIALTTQLVHRLREYFGDALVVYHSKINEQQRYEIWNMIISGQPYLIVGARSSLFLPFEHLGLIIVDEEHDPSFRQIDPAPRYNGRDLAIVLGQIHNAAVILGSATPSMESYWNARKGKYQLVSLSERYSQMPLPEVEVIDMKRSFLSGTKYLSDDLVNAIELNHKEGFQTILFQNRRGFAPIMFCTNCGWVDGCENCDVSLTYHKYQDQMQCHLCGHRHKAPNLCPACGQNTLEIKGLGTEQLEAEVKQLFPELNVGRLDLDTARGQKKLGAILERFALQEIDILIGTQMVSKGLDFDKVGLVGIISADQLMYFPDFRAAERAFQLMVQVSGRSGRKHRQGKVLIQTYNPEHPLLDEVKAQDFVPFFHRELIEREQFGYPPFRRLIRISCKHKDYSKLERAAKEFEYGLRQMLGSNLLGPSKPGVARIRGLYILEFLIKLPKSSHHIRAIKTKVQSEIDRVEKLKGLTSVRFAVQVDP